MELIVFDLDGTLLNRQSTISDYTSETLKLLSKREIAYTVATGRTLHGARAILEGHRFPLPQAYKNGVMIWHPQQARHYSRAARRSPPAELDNVVQCLCPDAGTDAFRLYAWTQATRAPCTTRPFAHGRGARARPESLGHRMSHRQRCARSTNCRPKPPITHVNCHRRRPMPSRRLCTASKIDEPHLVAYSGLAPRRSADWRWLDVHHSDASKGGAITTLKELLLGLERVICFGDSDNDLSMFEAADEGYAPANANDSHQGRAATAVIGHHDEEGIARFLRERYSL